MANQNYPSFQTDLFSKICFVLEDLFCFETKRKVRATAINHPDVYFVSEFLSSERNTFSEDSKEQTNVQTDEKGNDLTINGCKVDPILIQFHHSVNFISS